MARTPTSQNGWPVYTSGTHSDLVALPRVTGRVRGGDVATVLGYLADQFHARVEPVIKAHSWGYAYRAVRGQTSGYSNHASATAIDLNAPAHPLGASGTFTVAQRVQITAILAECGGVVRWGGTYAGRKDEMHFEINASASAVARAAARLRGTTAPSAPAPTTASGGLTMSDIATLISKLDYLSEQVKVTNQKGVDDRRYMQAQLKAVAEGAFGRDAINARNAEVAAIVQRAVATIPGVDSKAVAREVAAALAEHKSTVDVDAILDGIAKRMEA